MNAPLRQNRGEGLAAAGEIYAQILEHFPTHAGALHHPGVHPSRMKRHAALEMLIKQGLAQPGGNEVRGIRKPLDPVKIRRDRLGTSSQVPDSMMTFTRFPLRPRDSATWTEPPEARIAPGIRDIIAVTGKVRFLSAGSQFAATDANDGSFTDGGGTETGNLETSKGYGTVVTTA